MEDWLNACTGKRVYDFSKAEPSVYLLEEYLDPDEGAAAWKSIYPSVFEQELGEWVENPALWPADRSLSVFLDFFDVSLAGTVTDTIDTPFESYS